MTQVPRTLIVGEINDISVSASGFGVKNTVFEEMTDINQYQGGHHLTPLAWPLSGQIENSKCWREGCGEGEPSCPTGGNATGVAAPGQRRGLRKGEPELPRVLQLRCWPLTQRT